MKMKTYKLIYVDKFENELKTKNITALNLKDARNQRDAAFSSSMLNDLQEILIFRFVE